VLGGKVLPLTPTEFNLLIVLAKHSNTLVARDRLAQEVWGPVDSANSRAVDVHMRRLRAKLAHAAVNGPWIVSVRGLGYRLTADDPAKNAA
jgi:two-component system response regulator MtrA